MMPRCAAVVTWALVASSLLSGTEANKYAKAIAARCDGSLSDEAPDRGALEAAAGGDNWFLNEVLKKATSQDDIGNKLSDYMSGDGAGLARKGLGFVMFFLCYIVFFFCCWTCCPCCQCCRICRPKGDEKKENTLVLKLIGIALVGGIGLGVFISWIMAGAAHGDIAAGHERFGCTSAQFVQAIVEGQPAPTFFIGMTPMTVKFSELTSTLNEGSTFLTDFNSIIDSTKSIDVAVNAATETLELLKDMMALSDNANPHQHKCIFCETVAAQLEPTIEALRLSFALTLNAARAATKEALNADQRASMRNMLQSSTKPITDAKDALVKLFDPLVEEDGYNQSKFILDDMLGIGVYVLIGFAFVIVLVAAVSMACFLMRETDDTQSPPLSNKTPHRLSCCSWCCSCYVAMGLLFLGGLVEIMALPLGLVCLTLDEINGNMLEDIKPALNVQDLQGEQFQMFKDIFDKCLNPPDFNTKAYFSDLLRTGNSTMRELLDQQVKQAIDAPFAAISSSNSSDDKMADDPATASLREILRTRGPNVDTTIMPQKTEFEADSSVVTWSSLTSAWPGWATAMKCTDFTDSDGTTFPGISTYLNGETQVGFSPQFVACSVGTTVGTASCTGATENQCKASNALLTKKNLILSSSTPPFRCDVFEDPDVPGAACDIWDTTTKYETCQKTDGTYKRKQVQCTLDEFKTYITSFDTRIGTAFARVDTASEASMTGIDVNMRGLVKREITQPIQDIMDGLQCNFLARYFRHIIWGMCYEAVGGMNAVGTTYVVVGFLLIILCIVMYVFWRREIDNVNVDIRRLKAIAPEPGSTPVEDLSIVPSQPELS